MTTFMLFIYFLLQFAPQGFTGAQYQAIDKAFASASQESARQASGSNQIVPPAAPIVFKPAVQVQPQQFRPIVAQVVPSYQKPNSVRGGTRSR